MRTKINMINLLSVLHSQYGLLNNIVLINYVNEITQTGRINDLLD